MRLYSGSFGATMRRIQRPLFESLEDRRLLALSAELLFRAEFDQSDGTDKLSQVHEINGLLFAWVGRWVPGEDRPGIYEVVDPDKGLRWTVDGLPSQKPDEMVVFNDSIFLFYAERFGSEPVVGQEVWKTDGRVAEQVKDISEFGFTDPRSNTRIRSCLSLRRTAPRPHE